MKLNDITFLLRDFLDLTNNSERKLSNLDLEMIIEEAAKICENIFYQ